MHVDPPSTEPLVNQFLHVRVLLGMVVGLGLTHLLRNFARIIDRPTRQKTDWIHLLWAVSMFVYLVHFWWWEFLLSQTPHWTFLLYLFVTLYALLLYLLCAVIFPDALDAHLEYGAYFMSRRGWFFGLLALAYAVDLGDTWLKGEAHVHALGIEYPIRNVTYIACCLIAIATRSRRYHGAFVLLGLAYQVAFIFRQFETL